MKKKTVVLSLLAGIMTVASMAGPGEKESRRAPKWVTLFDGKSTKGWHTYHEDKVTGWVIQDGSLMTDGKGGDLVSDNEYGDFELEFDFKVNPKGNSGVMYKVIESPDVKKPYMTGPEYQVIDDANFPSPIRDVQKTGANYDMIAPSPLTAVKPAGEWNKGKIIVKNNHVEHILNGKTVVSYDYGSDQWKEMLAKSKFKDWPYATPHAKGKIAFQGDHDIAWFKNIRIREL